MASLSFRAFHSSALTLLAEGFWLPTVEGFLPAAVVVVLEGGILPVRDVW